MPEIVLPGVLCRLRPYRSDDVEPLLAVADDPLVTRWMTATFPNPYTRADAQAWVAFAAAGDPPQHFAIEVDGALAGAVGMVPLGGEHRGSAIFGYWLGRRYWGRGIASDAARTLARHGLRAQGLRRLTATVFAPNAASARVLEKVGFQLEGRVRGGCVARDGTVHDELIYGRTADDPEPPE